MYTINEKRGYDDSIIFELFGPGIWSQIAFLKTETLLADDFRSRISDILNLLEKVLEAGKKYKTKKVFNLLNDQEEPKADDYRIVELKHPKRFTIYGSGLPLLNHFLVFDQDYPFLLELIKLFQKVFFYGESIKTQEIRTALAL